MRILFSTTRAGFRSALALLGGGLALGLAGAARAASASQVPVIAEGPLVTLPPLLVEEKAVPLKWRYYQSPTLEVLAACDDRTAVSIVQRLQQLDAMMPRVIPARFMEQTTLPETLILVDEEVGQGLAQEAFGDIIKQRKERIRFMPNLRLPERDAVVTFAMVNKDSGAGFSYSEGRIAMLLERRTPALPDWFILGVSTLYPKLAFNPEGFRAGPADWLSPAESRALASTPDRPRTLLATEEMLTRTRRNVTRDEGDALWRAQATLFMYWTLIDDDGARREALWKFVDRLETEPLSEALFRECFGLGYADLRDELSDYLAQAVRAPGRTGARGGPARGAMVAPPRPPPIIRSSGPGGRGEIVEIPMPDLPPPQIRIQPPGIDIRVPITGRQPRVTFRAASDLEIARIRGDLERLEIPYVRARAPELVDKYVEQARATLLRPYSKGERNPQLLAIAGLTEIEAGNPDGALSFLEAAVQGNVQRPRAYFELARLRYAAFATTAGPRGKFTPAQVEAMVGPLLTAHTQKPSLLENYALMSDVLARGEAAPTAAQLEALHEGARSFPGVSELVARTIALHLAAGQPAAAAILSETGLRHAPDDAGRAKIEAARAKAN